jgi:hypothetical protein
MNIDEAITSTITVIYNYLTQISIPNFIDKLIDKKTVTFYVLQVINNLSKQEWSIEKRFSEFDDLHKQISRLVPNCPQLPGKTMFKVTSYEAINKRKNQLDQFIKECVIRKDILNCEAFRTFIEIDQHSPEITFYSPQLISNYDSLPLGVRDIVYLKYEGIMIVACSDMNITSRVDAYITNVNLPWEKKTDAHISVGAVFCFKVSIDSSGNIHIEQKLWAKSYPIQTGVLCWDSESNTLAVGLDNGKIFFYKVNPESNFMHFEEV